MFGKAHQDSSQLPTGKSPFAQYIAKSKMALGLGSGQAADEEARAEVEVLNSRLEKTTQLTKKIQASLGRLEAHGKSLEESIGPMYTNTQKLQVINRSKLAPIYAPI